MSSFNSAIDIKINDEQMPEEMALIVPSVHQLMVVPKRNESLDVVNPFDVRRQRKSYDYQQDLPVARIPSNSRPSNASLFLEYSHTNCFIMIKMS